MDQELVVRAQAGDPAAFEALTVADYPRLFRLAHGILRDRSRAEDATQQAYFDIWRNIRRLRDPTRFGAWSYRILVNACHREAKRTPRWLPEEAVAESQAPRAADDYAAILDHDELEAGFAQLNVDQRAVIVLHQPGRDLGPAVAGVRGRIGWPRADAMTRSMIHDGRIEGCACRPGAEPRTATLERPDPNRHPSGARRAVQPLWVSVGACPSASQAQPGPHRALLSTRESGPTR